MPCINLNVVIRYFESLFEVAELPDLEFMAMIMISDRVEASDVILLRASFGDFLKEK